MSTKTSYNPTGTAALTEARKRLEAMTFTGEYAKAMSAGRWMCINVINELSSEITEACFQRIFEGFEEPLTDEQEAPDATPTDDDEYDDVDESDADAWRVWRSAGGFV